MLQHILVKFKVFAQFLYSYLTNCAIIISGQVLTQIPKKGADTLNITILPYIDTERMQQQKDTLADAKKQETLAEFKKALSAASEAIEKLSQKKEAENATNAAAEQLYQQSNATAQSISIPAATENTIPEEGSGFLGCPDSLTSYFEEAADTYGVDVNLLKSIAKTESSFQADATSKAGAMGIMQLMPSTASSLGVTNAYDAKENILGGAKYISQLLSQYGGDTSLALAAYNAGSGNVAKYGGIPPFTETQNYVTKVLGYYNS